MTRDIIYLKKKKKDANRSTNFFLNIIVRGIFEFNLLLTNIIQLVKPYIALKRLQIF